MYPYDNDPTVSRLVFRFVLADLFLKYTQAFPWKATREHLQSRRMEADPETCSGGVNFLNGTVPLFDAVSVLDHPSPLGGCVIGLIWTFAR